MDKDIKKHVIKTGTTTVGIVSKEGIVIAADKRSTYGGDGGVSYIAEKDRKKIVEVTPDVIVTTAGTASDTRRVIKLIRSELRLKELKSKSKPSVAMAANLFSTLVYQNIRQPSMIPSITQFLLAGRDNSGVSLFNISPDGLLKEVEDYSASGSGMVNVFPILDTYYKKNISLSEAVTLAKKCVSAAIGRDPASGEGIDIYVVTKDEVKQVASQKLSNEFKDE
jgi:proteasome beta subunit